MNSTSGSAAPLVTGLPEVSQEQWDFGMASITVMGRVFIASDGLLTDEVLAKLEGLPAQDEQAMQHYRSIGQQLRALSKLKGFL
jgi:hypothetical protein